MRLTKDHIRERHHSLGVKFRQNQWVCPTKRTNRMVAETPPKALDVDKLAEGIRDSTNKKGIGTLFVEPVAHTIMISLSWLIVVRRR